MKSIEIKNNDADQRIDKFLSKAFKNLPLSMMYKQIRKKNIKLNGKRCSPSERLSKGDILTLYVNDNLLEQTYDKFDFIKAPSDVEIVYEDNNILLVNKNAGIFVHPGENYHFDSLISRVQHYLYNKGEYNPNDENSFAPALVNRIDRNTCGIVIVAKNAKSLKILNQKLKDREISKFYLCVVYKRMFKKTDTLTAFLEKDEKRKHVFVSAHPTKKSKTIKTKYKVLSEKGNISLLEIQLLTGRTHQIRAHMAYIGHPLLGDGKYGKNQKLLKYKYQALCSYKILFNFQVDAGELNYLKNRCFEVESVPFLKSYHELNLRAKNKFL